MNSNENLTSAIIMAVILIIGCLILITLGLRLIVKMYLTPKQFRISKSTPKNTLKNTPKPERHLKQKLATSTPNDTTQTTSSTTKPTTGRTVTSQTTSQTIEKPQTQGGLI